MEKFFYIMINVSTIVALITTILFVLGILFKIRSVSTLDVFTTCNIQIKACRVSSVVFVILYWFLVSGLPTSECLEGYKALSSICSIWGCVWIVLAFVNVAISIILGISKRGRDELEMMRKMRKSNFVMGAIFLVIGFLLKVN